MRDCLPCQSVLLAVLASSVALASAPYDKVVIRTEKISDHPGNPTSSVYVAMVLEWIRVQPEELAPVPIRARL